VVEDLQGPSDVIVSNDGRSVYAVSPVSSAIVHFSRDDDSASQFFGQLTFRASYSQSLTGASALNGASRLSIGAGGQQLYAVSPETGEIMAFATGINGELTPIGSAATAEPGTLTSASALLATSGSGAVLAASPTPGSLHVFKRMPGGGVTAVAVLIAGRDASVGLGGASALAQAPGQHGRAYVAAYEDDRISLLESGLFEIESLIFHEGFESSSGQ
jgi:6-phosphogluconolactonase (cycloisomerase 2 family)